MKIERDEYGYYEAEDNTRRYLKINGEEAERKVDKHYPQTLNNKKYPTYRNYLALDGIRGTLKSHQDYDTIEGHIKDALNRELPLPVRRMHFDIVGHLIHDMSFKDDEEKDSLIVVENNKITLNGHDSHIPFTKQNTDSERLKKLELECQRLREVLANYQKSSGLAQIADEFDRSVIRKIEGLYGRGLNSDEAYLLGRCLEGYGPNRTLSAVQNSIMTNNPLRAAYGMLRGGAVGKKMNRGEIPEPKVRTANVDFLEE